MSELEELERAIAALELQRAILGDAVVDASQAALREKLAALTTGDLQSRQRRQVTILFMDVVGSTSIIRELDPEDNLSIMDGALQQLAAPIIAHGGRVMRFMGDGLMALFGHPVASEQDPDMAVRAGLALLNFAHDYAGELEGQWGISGFNVRVGISTGLVAIGSGSEVRDTMAGTAINLAARLERAAAPGTVVISTDTYQHVRGAFDLEPLEPIMAKGFAEPVTIYRVLREKPRSFRTRRRGVEGIETRMIGRERELSLLQELFMVALLEYDQRMVTVIGDAGIGKSRLLYEFENWVDLQPVSVRLYRGRARLETQSVPYGLLRDIFAIRFEVQDDDPVHTVREKILAGFSEVMESGSHTQMRAHMVGQLLGYDYGGGSHHQKSQVDPQQVRDRALAYIIDYFRAAATTAPVLVLLEDLHWADDSSLDMLARVSLALQELRLFLVCTARPTLYERRRNWAQGLSFHTRLEVVPLSSADSERLVEEMLQKAQNVPSDLKRLVVDNTAGNPFFVEELVKMLVDDGIIVKGEAFWQVHLERLGKIHVPPTLTGVLQARLAALPWDERTVLEQASVVGRVFWDTTVSILNESSEARLAVDAVPSALQALLQQEMIYPRESSTFKETREYIFKHAVLREVTYESVLKQARRTYHGLVAGWLIGRSGERLEEFSGLIADHLERAGREAEALTYLDAAGKKAAAKYANDEAIEYYSRALRLTPEEADKARYELLLAREELYGRLGRRKEQQEDLHALAVLAERSRQLADQLEIALRWVAFYDVTGNYQTGVEAATRVVKQAEQAGESALAANGLRLWGRMLLNQGQYEAARLRFDQALVGFQLSEDRFHEGKTLNSLGGTAFYQGDYLAARDYYEQALKIARETGDRTGEAYALNNLGNTATEQGDYVTALKQYGAALTIYREIGDRFGEELALGNLGNAAFYKGEHLNVQSYYQQALKIASEIGDQDGEGWMLHGLGEALLMMGAPEEAATNFRQALAIREALGQQHLTFVSRAGLARAMLALGEVAEARSHVEPILAFLRSGGMPDLQDSMAVYLACILTLLDSDDPQAADMLQTAYMQLQQRARKITDSATRRSFLENIPWNREIVALWEAANAGKES